MTATSMKKLKFPSALSKKFVSNKIVENSRLLIKTNIY